MNGLYLEITTAEGTRVSRCPSCAQTTFGETPPEVLEDERAQVPAPTLGVDLVRQPSFVTPQQAAQSARYARLPKHVREGR